MTGLDLIIIRAVKDLLGPIVFFTGGDLLGTAVMALSPVVVFFSKYMDRKIKERNKKK